MTASKIDRRINMVLIACALVTLVIVAVILPSAAAAQRNTEALRKVAESQAKSQVVSDCKSKITGDAEIAVGDGVKIVIDGLASLDPVAGAAQLRKDAGTEKAEIDRTQDRRKQINVLCSAANAATTLKEETP